MHQTSQRISRRALLKVTFAAGLGGGILASLGAAVAFLYPSAGKDPGRALVGGVGTFPAGSKTFFKLAEESTGLDAWPASLPAGFAGPERSQGARGIWLVRLAGGFLALSARCTHLGCTVPWRREFTFADPRTGQDRMGWFRCPCHAATFDEAGVRVFGPAPRSLDRFDVKVAGGKVYVNFKTLHTGTPDNARYAVDPDARF